ncbi:MAG: chemotaxis protein CheA [Candidatus Hydrothermales bacterium]
MIDNKYIELFKSEAEEIINNLEKAILELEKKGWTQGLINEIFRYAHTLKGMAAAVERKDIEEFCHNLEDEFDELRKGEKKDLDFDFLFKAVDSLKVMLKEEKRITIEELKSFKEIESFKKIYEIEIYLDPETQFFAARMLVILKTIKEKFDLISSEPREEDILKGEVENVLKVVIKTDKDEKKINEILESFVDIEHYFLRERKEFEREEKEIEIKPLEEIRVRSEKLDRLIDTLGELVIEKERLFSKLKERKERELEDSMENLERLISYLQDEVMSIRLIPAIQILERFKRFVRDKAKEMGKEVELVIEGGNIELDRVLLEEMREPLLHIIRNSIDHGVEFPKERISQGKPSKGKILIRLEREKNSVTIFVMDDGKGIDKRSVLKKAVERGLISEERAKALTEKEIFELITIPGFSTKEDTTTISGRGVGLDIVKQFVTKMGGFFEIDSKFTKGTTIKLRLPLSLAITKGVVVSVAGHRFVIPLIFIHEIIEGKIDDIKKMMGKDYMLVREEVLPCIWMSKKLNLDSKKNERFSALLIESDRKRALLLVDKVLTQMDVVVKPLDIYLMRIPYVSGGTILWDGTVAIIIDPSKFLES